MKRFPAFLKNTGKVLLFTCISLSLNARAASEKTLISSIKEATSKGVTNYVEALDPVLTIGGIEISMLRTEESKLAMDLYCPSVLHPRGPVDRVSQVAYYIDFKKLISIIQTPNLDIIKKSLPSSDPKLFSALVTSQDISNANATFFSIDSNKVYLWSFSIEVQKDGYISSQKGILQMIDCK